MYVHLCRWSKTLIANNWEDALERMCAFRVLNDTTTLLIFTETEYDGSGIRDGVYTNWQRKLNYFVFAKCNCSFTICREETHVKKLIEFICWILKFQPEYMYMRSSASRLPVLQNLSRNLSPPQHYCVYVFARVSVYVCISASGLVFMCLMSMCSG